MINDKNKLQKLRKHWLTSGELDGFKREMPDYIVYVVHNDSIIGHLNAMDYKDREFLLYDTIQTNNANLEPYPAGIEGDFGVYETVLETDTVTQSRLLSEQIAKIDNVYHPKNDFKWIKFDGQFRFSICSKGTKSLRKINNLEDVIYSKIKNKEFIISFGVLSPSEYLGQIICNESFYNEIKNDIPEWEDFEFTIPEYSKWQPWHLTTLGDGITVYLFSTDKSKLDYLGKIMKVD